MRGRGGGVEDVVYENLWGSVEGGIQITLNYQSAEKTNATATPAIRRITVRDVVLDAKKSFLECDGLDDSPVSGIEFRPLDDSIRDCVESLISVAGIQPVRRRGADES